MQSEACPRGESLGEQRVCGAEARDPSKLRGHGPPVFDHPAVVPRHEQLVVSPTGRYDPLIVDRWGFCMTTVTVSEKYQVVIPKAVRESLQIRPGQKLEVIVYEGRAELVPVGDLREARGFLRGIDTEVPREVDRV